MATYPRITPATQANFAPVINDPQDTEDANKLAQVDLQTRRFIADYFATLVDSTTEKIKATAIDPATSLAGLVNGSTGNSGTQRQVVQGTLSTPDFRAAAVTTAVLADQSVTSAKIVDGNVNTTQLAALAVTAAKIAANTITSAQLAANAVVTANITDANVTTSKIADANVTSAKIAANSLGGSQLVLGSAAGQILVTGLTPFTFAVVTPTGDVTIDSTGKFTIVANGLVVVEERAALNVQAGAGTSATWNNRGVGTAWVKTMDTLTSSFLTTPVDQKLTLAAGKYVIEASAPAYETAGHQTRINHFNSSNASLEKFYGSSETSPVAAALVTRSSVRCQVMIAAGDYVVLEHYINTHTGGSDFGLAVNATGGLYEIYARVSIQKVG